MTITIYGTRWYKEILSRRILKLFCWVIQKILLWPSLFSILAICKPIWIILLFPLITYVVVCLYDKLHKDPFKPCTHYCQNLQFSAFNQHNFTFRMTFGHNNFFSSLILQAFWETDFRYISAIYIHINRYQVFFISSF